MRTFERDNLVARLFLWERERRERVAYRYLQQGEEEGARLTWSELAARARRLAGELLALAEPGDRALLILPPDLEFAVAFSACLISGVVAVPVPVPKAREGLHKLAAIAGNARPAVVLTNARSWEQLSARWNEQPELAPLAPVLVDTLPELGRRVELPEPEPERIAFLQYTSGSTGTPKGVCVTHANLLANERMIADGFGHGPDEIVVGWLPLYHDMGLIGNLLQPMYLGASCVLMNPVDFIQRPARWLQAIAKYRATTSGGPNFAFELCNERVVREEIAGADLSSWRVAFSGAEPVRSRTLARFAQKFGEFGFDPRALYPCYGMAECTLFATGPERESGFQTLHVDRGALESNSVRAVDASAAGAQSLVGCGRAWSEHPIAIVDPETGRVCAEDRVGEIWVSGPHVARGYWEDAARSSAVFGATLPDRAGTFLRTGDLGFVRAGNLFITGRLSDIIIVRGRNYYPQDIELTAQAADVELRGTTRGAAFGMEIDGAEELVIVQEVRRDALSKLGAERIAALQRAIRAAVAEEHGLQPAEVVLVRPSGVPCTTSGKVRRRHCRLLHERRELPYLSAEPQAARAPVRASNVIQRET